NPRRGTELALEPPRLFRQRLAHRHEATQRTAIDCAACLLPGHDHLVADVIEDLAAMVEHYNRQKTKRPIEKAVDTDPAEPLREPRRARDIDEQHKAIFLDGGMVAPGDEIHERPPAD